MCIQEEYVRGVSGWNFGDILSTTKLDSEDMPRSHIKEEKVDNMRRLEEDLTDGPSSYDIAVWITVFVQKSIVMLPTSPWNRSQEWIQCQAQVTMPLF